MIHKVVSLSCMVLYKNSVIEKKDIPIFIHDIFGVGGGTNPPGLMFGKMIIFVKMQSAKYFCIAFVNTKSA